MEVAFEPLQINDISTMAKSCVVEDNSIYEECSICCESFTNKSFINECLHPFCYQCILDWTKVKAVCPLCIGPITGILHNIRSQDDYDIEKVEPPRVDVLANIDNDLIFDIDDTDTDSSYGGMESMDMESDYDNSIIYDGNEDFDGANYDNETGNFFNYLSNNELSHDDDDDEASEHSNENEEESEDEAEGDAEEDDASCNNSSDQEEEDDDDEVQNDEFFNVDSESDAEDEHADDEYDCDSNDGDNDADSDNDNDYFDNYEQDDDNDDDDDDDDDEDGEEEPDNDDSDEDNDDNDYEDTLDAETYDVSDDDSEEPGVEYSPSSASEDEYYY